MVGGTTPEDVITSRAAMFEIATDLVSRILNYDRCLFAPCSAERTGAEHHNFGFALACFRRCASPTDQHKAGWGRTKTHAEISGDTVQSLGEELACTRSGPQSLAHFSFFLELPTFVMMMQQPTGSLSGLAATVSIAGCGLYQTSQATTADTCQLACCKD